MSTTTTKAPRTSKPAKAPRATKPAALAKAQEGNVPDAPAIHNAPADANTPPAGGYILASTACPSRGDSSRAARWPLVVEHAGKPGGVAALHTALKAMPHWSTGKGMAKWLHNAGLATVHGLPPRPAKPAGK